MHALYLVTTDVVYPGFGKLNLPLQRYARIARLDRFDTRCKCGLSPDFGGSDWGWAVALRGQGGGKVEDIISR